MIPATPLRRATAALVVAAVACLPAAAQELPVDQRWRWTHFGTDAGLPDNDVLDVIETRSGLVWAATKRGIAWYDGFRWIPVATPTGNHRQIKIAPAADGRGLIAVVGERLWVGDTAGFTRFPVQRNGRDAEVVAAVAAPGGGVLALSHSAAGMHLQRIDERGRGEPFPVPGRLPRRANARIWYGAGGAVWINADGGLFEWTATGWDRRLAAPGVSLWVSALTHSPDGAAIVYVWNPRPIQGLWAWDRGKAPSRDVGEGFNAAVALARHSSGEMLAAYEMSVVRRKVGDAWETLDFPPEIAGIRALRFRPNGDLWVATREGVYLFRRSAQRWTVWSLPFPNLHNRINALARTRDGTLWTGTGGGIAIHHPDGRVELITQVAGTRLGPVTAVAEDLAGNVWVGSGSAFRGVFRWDGHRWHHHGSAFGLGGWAHHIAKDRSGRLWFLTIGGPEGRTGDGALVLENGRLSPWTGQHGFPDSTGRVYAFAHGADDSYWFGATTGIYRWKQGRWTTWPRWSGLRGRSVFAIAIDSTGRVWAADRESGLAQIDENDRLTFVATEDGLMDDRVWALATDPSGRLWAATETGLASHRDGVWTAHPSGDGLPAAPVWPLLAESTQVTVGTLGGGLVTLDLGEDTLPPPRILLDRPIADETGTQVHWRPSAYWGQQSATSILTRFRVDDGAWSEWSIARETHLVGLASGRHRFTIQAQGVFGLPHVPSTTLEFRVPAPLVRRPAFVIPVLGLSLLLGALLLYHGVRRRRSDAEKRALETQLRQAQKLEAVGRLAGGIAHDFNNLLTAIRGNATLLADALPAGAPGLADLAQIRGATDRGAALVKKLLVFARGTPLDMTPVDLPETVRDMSELLGRLLPETIELQLPPPRERCVVLGDPGAIQQIVVNLATNARDAMPEGGTITIAVDRAAPTPGSGAHALARLVLRDTGHGMSESTRQRAFDPFFTTKGPDGGSGLGLTMVYSLVRQQGGFVDIASTPQSGTTVTVHLPLAPEGSEPASATSASRIAGGSETILLVEDDTDVRDVTRRFLASRGYTVLTAANGEEALATLRAAGHAVDVVISDVVMPKVGGPELYRQARAMGVMRPFIFTSGYAQRSESDTPLPDDAPLLSKPWTGDELLHAVRAAVAAQLSSPLAPDR